MKRITAALAFMFLVLGASEAFAQCGRLSSRFVCQQRVRPVVRFQRVCVQNFRGCYVQRVQPVVMHQTRTVVRMRSNACSQGFCVPTTPATPTTPDGAYYTPGTIIESAPVIQPQSEIVTPPPTQEQPPQPKDEATKIEFSNQPKAEAPQANPQPPKPQTSSPPKQEDSPFAKGDTKLPGEL